MWQKELPEKDDLTDPSYILDIQHIYDHEKEAQEGIDELAEYFEFGREIEHMIGETPVWHQYNVKLASRGCGWEDILRWADYMMSTDLTEFFYASVSDDSLAFFDAARFTNEYLRCGSFLEMPELAKEHKAFTLNAEHSKSLCCPIRIEWFNNENYFTLHVKNNDVDLMKRYAETMVRMTFGTPDAFKLGKPLDLQPR